MRRPPHLSIPSVLITLIAFCFVGCGSSAPGSINTDPFKIYQTSEIEADQSLLNGATLDLESVGMKFVVSKKTSKDSVKWDEKAISKYKGKVSDVVGPLETYLVLAEKFLKKYGTQYRIEGEKVVKYHTLTPEKRADLEVRVELVKRSLEQFDPAPQGQQQIDVEFELESPNGSKQEGEKSRAPRNPVVNPGPLVA